MKTKNLLLVTFTSIIALTVTVFGFVSYNISSDIAINQQKEFISGLTTEEAERLSLLIPAGGTEDGAYWKEWLTFNEGQSFIDIIADDKKVLTASLSNDEMLQHLNLSPDQVMKLFNSGEEAGYFESNHRLYIWAIAPIANSNLRLLNLQFNTETIGSSLSTLTTRLIVLALIIIWLSSWVVLLVATVITHLLEKQNSQLVYKSLHDELTDLGNRHLLLRELGQIIDADKLQKKWLALLIADIDRFKEFNNTLGHESGDQLLQQVAERFIRNLPSDYLVTRISSDEFGIMAMLDNIDECGAIAQKIEETLARPFKIAGQTIKVDVSIGIAIYPKHGTNAASLVRHAEIAMYNAKESTGAFVLYNSSKDPHSRRKLELSNHLRNALANNEMQLHYQPKLNLRSSEFDSVEALLRWYHPTKGILYPEEIIPLAEQTGIIRPLTMWILETAIAYCAKQQQQGRKLNVAINISSSDAGSDNLPERLAQLLHKHGVEPRKITLEISERNITASGNQLLPVMNELAALGVQLSIDDFGSGYTSLNFLNRLPINEIKIDHSLIAAIDTDNNDSLVHSIIELSHSMSYRVVAEGVETAKVLQRLRAMHCDLVQGYYLCYPMEQTELASWLDDSSKEMIKLALL